MREGPRTILLVDDSDELLESCKLILETAGYSVRTALNGEEAFVQIRNDRPDLVLLDVVMPRMGGLELLLKLRSDLPPPLPPIILWSGSDLTEEEALRRGAVGFMQKPVARGDLLSGVGRVLENSERPVSFTTERCRTALLEAIGEASADGILVVSHERRIVSANARMLEMWGLTAEALATRSDGRALAFVLPKIVDPDGFLGKVRYLYDHPDERSWDEVALKDGRVFERYSAPVVASPRTRCGRVWFTRDVTARKQAEQLVTKLRQDFAAAIVHDLRAPIQTIMLQSELLLRSSSGSDSAVDSAVRRIEKQALRLSRMTTDLLDVTTIDLGRLQLDTEPVQVAALIGEIVESFKPILDGHVVRIDVAEALPRVQADRHRLGQVFMNLLVNAASYSPEGRPIDVDARARDGGIMLSVRDQGVGIPSEDLPHIFERFFRSEKTRAARPGYGLGLHVAHALVAAHRGHIDVESTPGAGTTFRVWLPALS
jgi:two-component system, OmpR family, sensor histidine kinase VicK